MGRPILLLEINEVPWKLVDLYLQNRKFKYLKEFFLGAQNMTSIAVDSGELSPWVTWPSLHRGMSNTEHGILNLGQDVATFKGVPIWDEYLHNGHSVGVFGSFQSWPPKVPGVNGFFIPDTFAHDEKCFPEFLQPLQKFNLSQVRENGRLIEKKSLRLKDFIALFGCLVKAKVQISTYVQIIKQLVMERFDRTYLERRRVFQTILFWDIFKGLYKPKNPPLFATFFTNHLASAMHRFWHHLFPEEFAGHKISKHLKLDQSHKKTVDFSMMVLEKIIADAFQMIKQNPDLIVIFASSMGQDTIYRESHEGVEAAIKNVTLLLQALDVDKREFKELLAMVPQVSIEVMNQQLRGKIIQLLQQIKKTDGNVLFNVSEQGDSLTITITRPTRADFEKGGFNFEGKFIRFSDAGINLFEREPGTAYHIPEGIFSIYGAGITASNQREQIQADQIKGYIMRLSGAFEKRVKC